MVWLEARGPGGKGRKVLVSGFHDHGDVGRKSLRDGLLPLPNGLFMAFKWGVPNHLEHKVPLKAIPPKERQNSNEKNNGHQRVPVGG